MIFPFKKKTTTKKIKREERNIQTKIAESERQDITRNIKMDNRFNRKAESVNQNNKNISGDLSPQITKIEFCPICNKKIEGEGKRPQLKWKMDQTILICSNCYSHKETQYEKLINYCSICGTKLKFIRYNPKPNWQLSGQLCRHCWDSENKLFDSNKNRLKK